MTGVDDRLSGELSTMTADEAAASIPDDGTLLTSGFGRVGYPKAVPEALAASGRDLSLTIISGGSVGAEIDEALVEVGAIVRRYPFQANSRIRTAINAGEIAFQDRNISTIGDDVRFGNLYDGKGVAVVEAVAAGPDWFVPSTSVGHVAPFVAAADELVIEVNNAQRLSLSLSASSTMSRSENCRRIENRF